MNLFCLLILSSQYVLGDGIFHWNVSESFRLPLKKALNWLSKALKKLYSFQEF